MPQISRGGKYVFGWSITRDDGTIVIPQGAFREYGLKVDAKVILISGSWTSGGFGINPKRLLEGSQLGVMLTANEKANGHPEMEICQVFIGR